MNSLTSPIEVKPDLIELVKNLYKNNREITLISLCTKDGFNIKSFASKSLPNSEPDKIAAMASSLCALSDSSALNLTNENFNITTIESEGGNILFMSSRYLDKPCVVTIAGKTSISLAQLRFYLKRFVGDLEAISN
jgi:predicted regulator of Ras-like GTPase activity (Roadblock/LC7/MglB family)